jgi:2,4-dienoyl-CoA reductase (NADPH2)
VFAKTLEEAGVDALNVTGGWHETRVPQLLMCIPPGTFSYLARGVKEVVNIPVVGCNRINDPHVAQRVLIEGSADYVGMARAFLADPWILKKAKEGRTEEIVHCIGCAQACFDHIFMMRPISCLMNPRCGREFEIEALPAARRKKVWVIGGGPGGMMAAATAAKRGHEVTLFERQKAFGGQLRLAGVPAMRRGFQQAADDLEAQIRIAGSGRKQAVP